MDGRWATVGSSNIDPFSLLLAREANVVVRDTGFAARLRESLLHAMEKDAVEITPAGFKRSSLFARAMRWTANWSSVNSSFISRASCPRRACAPAAWCARVAR